VCMTPVTGVPRWAAAESGSKQTKIKCKSLDFILARYSCESPSLVDALLLVILVIV
jgi:hypothetical protein